MSNVLHVLRNSGRSILYSLRGSNLEVFKFGMYLMFPIGWMYYFGTNLENRFAVPDFWPTQEQSHRIPYEKEEIRAEVHRIQAGMRRQAEERARKRSELEALAGNQLGFRRDERSGELGGGGGDEK